MRCTDETQKSNAQNSPSSVGVERLRRYWIHRDSNLLFLRALSTFQPVLRHACQESRMRHLQRLFQDTDGFQHFLRLLHHPTAHHLHLPKRPPNEEKASVDGIVLPRSFYHHLCNHEQVSCHGLGWYCQKLTTKTGTTTLRRPRLQSISCGIFEKLL